MTHRSLFAAAPALALSAAAALHAQAPQAAPGAQTPSASTARLVSVGTHGLRLDCGGEGSPVILIEVGHSSDGRDWRATVDSLRRDTRVCIYARAGYPGSEPGPMPRDAARCAAELHALVRAAAIPTPLILAAHSLGAMHAVVFAGAHRDLLAGMALFDPPPLPWLDGRAFASIRERTQGVVTQRRQRAEQFRSSADSAERARVPVLEALASELETSFTSTPGQVAAVVSLGDLPLVVVSAGRADTAYYGAEAHAFTRAWIDQGRAFAALSTRGRAVLIPESGHNLPVQAPSRVLEEIRGLLAEVRRAPPRGGR